MPSGSDFELAEEIEGVETVLAGAVSSTVRPRLTTGTHGDQPAELQVVWI